MELESESLYDSVRRKWAERVTGITSGGSRLQSVPRDQEQPSTSSAYEYCSEGWALKTVKKVSRMTEKVKLFITEKFDAGVSSGQKADPIQVAKEMKFAKDDLGKHLFTPDEWRTAQQITNVFSRLSAGQRQRQTMAIDEQIPEEDIDAINTEIAMSSLQDQVLADMDTPDHHIKVGSINLCHLVHAGKLNSLKIVELRCICQELQLEVTGRLTRKRAFTEPSEAYVKLCRCFQE